MEEVREIKVSKNEDDVDLDFENEEIVQTSSVSNKIYTINFDSTIDEADKYRKVFECLRTASKNDTIRIIMSSFGGYVYSFIQIYNHLINCKAKTICEVYTAYSAGSLIALSCDEVIPKTFSGMMVHEVSYGSRGKNSEIKKHVDFTDKRSKTIAKYIYKGFMTDDEIKRMTKGEDFWFEEKEIKKRLKNWTPIRERNDK